MKRIINILNINLDNIYITERDGTIWVSSDGMSDDIIQKLYDVNLDGNGSSIDKETLDNEYLESLREESKLSFLQKSIVFLLCA